MYDMLLEEVKNTKILLKAGVTSMRECGALGTETVALRNAINAGKIVGPTMKVCASPIAVIGGHYGGYRPTGPIAYRQKTRELFAEGVDFIKLMVTGGISGAGRPGAQACCTDMLNDEIQAAVEIAHNHNLPVAAHCTNRESILNCVNLGVDIIEHASFLDDEVIDVILEHDVWVCPTFFIYEQIINRGVEGGILKETVDHCRDNVWEPKLMYFKKAYARGVKFFEGRDSGSFYVKHDDYPGELLSMEFAGMSKLDCIKSCTEYSAKALGLWENAGSLEAGKWSDVLIINQNPLEDLHAFYDRSQVFKFGTDVEKLLVD